jgi:hypothetical protein
LGYSQWDISLPSRDNSAPTHGAFALLKPPSELTWPGAACCKRIREGLLEVGCRGSLAFAAAAADGVACCARCCGRAHSRCVVAFGVFPTGYFAHLRRFGMRSCAWMCFGVFPMGYFLALGSLQRDPGWSWAGPHCPCRAPPSWRCGIRRARA